MVAIIRDFVMAMNGEVLNLLKRVGLNQYESSIYTALLTSGTSTAGDLSSVADVPRSRVYDVLTELEKKGFAIIQVGRPVKYSAVTPNNIIEQIRANYEKEYQKNLDSFAKLESRLLKELGPLHAKGKQGIKSEDSISVLRGKSNLYGHIKQLINDSQTRVVKMTTEDGLVHLEKHCRPALEKAKKRGVKTKVIASINSSELSKNAKKLKSSISLKKAKGIEGRFLIKDGKEAVLVTSPEDTGLWIKSPYLASYLEKLFEHAWEKGEPIGN